MYNEIMAKFLDSERDLLAEICQNYPILADMGYTLEVIREKKEAWSKIQSEFNALNHGRPPRDVDQLKGLWKRLKMKTKAELDARQTGEGPSKPPLAKAEQIMSKMIAGQFDPLSDNLDDDDTAEPFQEEPEMVEFKKEEEEMTFHEEETSTWSLKRKRIFEEYEGTDEELFTETESNSLKRKPNNDEAFQKQLLEFARKEHEEKMKILTLKREIAELKRDAAVLKFKLIKDECTNKSTGIFS